MECKITKYSIIEAYPSILKHKLPIIEIMLFIIYVLANIFVLFKIIILGLYKNIKSLINLKYIFINRNKTYEIVGGSGHINYEINCDSIENNSLVTKLEDIKPYIIKTIVTEFQGKKAIDTMKSLLYNHVIDSKYISYLPTSKYFVLKKEEMICNANNIDDSLHDQVFVVKSYNEPTMIVVSIFKKLKLGVSNEHKIN